MIHRDLKPSNIFINRAGDVEIGDFGLATAGKGVAKKSKKIVSDELSARTTSLTTGVGTPFYLAPEQNRPGENYDLKVDIYSLGIILMEMCFPFHTSAERRAILTDLRQPRPKFPRGFEEQHLDQAHIIRWLLSSEPNDRPGTKEILDSDYLPAQLEDEILKEAIKVVISQPNSSIYDHLLTRYLLNPCYCSMLKYSLFEEQKGYESYKDYTFGYETVILILSFSRLLFCREISHASLAKRQ